MRCQSSLITYFAIVFAGFAFVALVLLGGDPARAQEIRPSEFASRDGGSLSEVSQETPTDTALLSFDDRIATLHILHLALNETADGGTFTWQAPGGRLGGIARPLSSFKSASGQVCRHLIVALATPSKVRQIEGIACRGTEGSWSFDG